MGAVVMVVPPSRAVREKQAPRKPVLPTRLLCDFRQPLTPPACERLSEVCSHPLEFEGCCAFCRLSPKARPGSLCLPRGPSLFLLTVSLWGPTARQEQRRAGEIAGVPGLGLRLSPAPGAVRLPGPLF